ncbi:MAG: 1-aminocyclopropane-1-carboxylate deaminase/D-cysteine desulfhydrase [Enterobacteriaceae bacterium]
MQLPEWQPSARLQLIDWPWLAERDIHLAMLRLDQIDPLISGNKWYKLRGYIEQAEREGYQGLITLGGAHSNHLHALAAAGRQWGFPTVGLVRGNPVQTPTTQDLQAWGMQLHWLGYAGYRARHQPEFWQPWQQQYPHLLPVLEGGGGVTGTKGCIGLIDNISAELPHIGWSDYDALWIAVGTGTTLAGLVLGEQLRHPVIGALAVPGDHGVAQQLSLILQQAGHHGGGYRLTEASRGGFARLDKELAEFMRDFSDITGVILDPLYTGKMMLALQQEIIRGEIAGGSRIIAIHSGGLQGLRGMEPRIRQLLR